MNQLLSTFRYAALPEKVSAFRTEVRTFIHATLQPLPPQQRARSWMAFDVEFSRKLAERGWVGVTLPKKYGGANLDAYTRFVLAEELLAVGAPVAAHWFADRQSGPHILKLGTEAQRSFYLPKICSGKAFFCIGLSEPNAGSDLASVGTRATKIDGGWQLNGKKVWTTGAHHCQYMIALVRSSGEVEDRQKGLSQFIVDLSLPGVTIRPIQDLTGNAHFNEVFFDDVILAEDALIGSEGNGWVQVNEAELSYERSGPERIYSSIVLLEYWIACLRGSQQAKRFVETIGRFATHLATLRNMSIAVTARLARGESPKTEAALIKDIGTEFEQSIPAILEAAVSADPDAVPDVDLLATVTFLSQIAPAFSLRGGTREILRGIVARSLDLR